MYDRWPWPVIYKVSVIVALSYSLLAMTGHNPMSVVVHVWPMTMTSHLQSLCDSTKCQRSGWPWPVITQCLWSSMYDRWPVISKVLLKVRLSKSFDWQCLLSCVLARGLTVEMCFLWHSSVCSNCNTWIQIQISLCMYWCVWYSVAIDAWFLWHYCCVCTLCK
jgi:hypothetical protein